MKRQLFLLGILLIFSGALSGQERSVFDLRNTDFEEPVNLAGVWDFYWQQLLDSVQGKDQFVPMNVPGDWHYPPYENQFTQTGYGTYRTNLVIDAEPQEDIGLFIPHIFSSYKLIINNEVIYQSGKVGRSKSEYVPNREPKVFNLSSLESENLEVIIQVANYDHLNSGMHYELQVGKYASLVSELSLQQDVNLFLAGGLFITGFVLLAFAFAYKQLELQIPFYAIFSISLMYRMLGSDPYPLHSLFSNYPFIVSIHLEYLSIHTAALFGGLFVFYLYPKQTNNYLRYVFITGTLISAGGVILLEPLVFTGLLKYFLFFVIFYVAVFIYVIARARIEKEVTSGFLMFALVVVLLWTVFQIVTFLDLGKVPYYINIILMSMIVIFCNLALFRTFMLKIQSVDLAQAELNLNKAKQNMLSLISHEIKTPVATLRMNIEMLRASHQSGRAITASMMDKIVDGSSEAVIDIKQMVNDFVYFMSRADTGVEKTTKQAIADRLKSRFGLPESHINLDFTVDESYPTDLLTLEYMISTLMSNAEKYSTTIDRKPEINVFEDSGKLTIQVKDYGIGMNEEQIKKLSKTKLELNENDEISGVGFYLARELASQLGHNLIIESQVGLGTSIRIELVNDD